METMTTEQVAELMQVTPPTVYRWVKEGALPAHKIGRTLRFKRTDIEAALGTSDGPTTGESPEVVGPAPALVAESASPFDSIIQYIADGVEEELRRRGFLA